MKKGIFTSFLLTLALLCGGWSTSDNNISLGDGAASNKTVTANKGSGTTNPKIRFNNTSSFWDFTNDGTNFFALTGLTATQTMTGKTLDGDDNTFQDIPLTAIKTVGGDANKVIRRDGSGVIQSGNSIPNTSALVTTDSSSTLTVKTIDGDDNTLQDVALTSIKTVGGDANKVVRRDGSGVIQSGNTLPNTDPIVTTTATQDLTNKELTNPLIDNYFDINEESAPGTPSSNTVRVYAKSDAKLYKKDDTGVETEIGGGGGSGSGEPNVITNSSEATNWAASNTGITVATTVTSTDLPLEGIVGNAIKITPVSGTDYVRYRWTMPVALKNKRLKAEWYQRPLSGYVHGDLKFEVYKNSASNYSGSYTEFDLSTDSSGTTSIPNETGKYTTTFVTDDADYYEIRYVRTAGTTALNIASVVVGPGIQPQGSVVETTKSIALTYSAGWGTTSLSSMKYERVGEMMHLHGSFRQGTVAGSAASFDLPAGFTIDFTKMTSNVDQGQVGVFQTTHSSAALLTSTDRFGALFSDLSDTNTIFFSVQVDTAKFVKSNGSGFATTNQYTIIDAWIPIAEWSGSGTVNLAQNDVEYASVGGTWDADSSTTVYGMGGVAMGGALAATRLKTITWQTPIQATDRIQVWASRDQITWVPINGSQIGPTPTNVIPSASSTGSGFSGVMVRAGGSTTQTIVAFQRYAAAANDDSPVDDWPSSSAYWVATKSKAGIEVGFGLAKDGSAGLISYYQDATVSLVGSGNYTTGSVAYITRVGKAVTIVFNLAYSSSSSQTSAAGAIPAWARPVLSVSNNADLDSSRSYKVTVLTDGTVSSAQRDWAGSTSNTTGMIATISYVIP